MTGLVLNPYRHFAAYPSSLISAQGDNWSSTLDEWQNDEKENPVTLTLVLPHIHTDLFEHKAV